jgi:mannosyl-oligosaccharide glucosidase
MRLHLLALTLGVTSAFSQPTTSNHSAELLWGPYRSNLYFGMRPRLPQSLMTGLMWFGTHEYPAITSMFNSLMIASKIAN